MARKYKLDEQISEGDPLHPETHEAIAKAVNNLDDRTAVIETALTTGLPPTDLSATIAQLAVTHGDWADTIIRSQAMLAPPINTPTIDWTNGSATAMSSPVEYRPAICGIGSKTNNWDGKSDTQFRFHSGRFYTSNGANSDLALYGELKPGGSAQAANWPVIVEFDTSAGVDAMEIAFWGPTTPSSMRLEVGGLPAIGDFTLQGPTGLGNGRKATLTFPDARSRRIRIYTSGSNGFYGVRVPTGQSITKPTEPLRTGAIIGDSFVNGSGSVATFPAGAGIFDTWALRVLKALGCNDFVLAGIGGTGFVSTNPTSHYQQRLSQVLAFSPDVLISTGSINDGPGGTGVKAAAEAFFDASTAVPERYAVGVMRAGYEANHDALKAAAEVKSVPFVPMRGFLFGTGKVIDPKGNGNADIFIMNDGAHPTFSAHRSIEQAIWRQMSRLRS